MFAVMLQTFKEAIRSKWLVMFTVLFFFLAFNIPAASLMLLRLLNERYVSHFIGSMITVSFPILPLLPLPLGSTSIVEERESGVLQYILSTRISRVRFMLARFAGLFVASTSIIALGFGGASLLAFRISPTVGNIWFVVLASCVLTASMLGIALLISVVSSKWKSALAVSIFVWLAFTVVSDSVVIAQTFVMAQRLDLTLPFIFLNPVELSRLLALSGIGYTVVDPGTSGQVMMLFFGDSLPMVLGVALMLWIRIPMAFAIAIFATRDIH
jgi:ABC-type transport system involved in multi-copper enzyme maturation permease subunit